MDDDIRKNSDVSASNSRTDSKEFESEYEVIVISKPILCCLYFLFI